MFEEYLDLFMSYLESDNKSEKTNSEYRKKLKEFYSFLENKGIERIKDIETVHIDLYKAWLMKKNKSATVANKISVLRTFFKYLKTRKYISENPMDTIDGVKIKDIDRKKKETLTLKEALKLIKKTEENSIPLLKIRNKILVIAFLFFGLRVSELCTLKLEDIDFKNKTLFIKGKGGKIREVPILNEIAPDLKEYIKAKKVKSEYFFNVKKTNEPLKPRATLNLIKHHAKKARIKKNIGCHSLRRTAATLLLEAGIDIRKIQIFLGHKSIATTMLYLNPDIEKVKQEIREKNILAKELRKEERKKAKEGFLK